MKKFFIAAILFWVVVGMLFVTGGLAANPDAGSILSEQRQHNLQNYPSDFPDEAVQEEPELEADANVTAVITAVEFFGYEGLVSVAELDGLVAPYLGKELNFVQLQTLARVVTQHLREEKGHLLARAYLPQQDVTDGILRINIMIGKLEGKPQILIKGDHRISRVLLERIAEKSLPENEAIYLNDLERAVLLINDLPGISAKAYLDKGKVPGTSTISLEAREGPWCSAVVSGDNFGNRYTGRFRRTAQTGMYDIFGKGDLFSLAYVNADDLHQGKFGLSFPIGARGAFFNLSYSGLRYELGGKLENLRSKGHAYTWISDIQYPLKRTKRQSVWLGAGVDQYLLEDKLNDAVTSDRNVFSGKMNLAGNFYDSFLGGGLTSFSLDQYAGHVDVIDGQADDLAGARTSGKFFKTTYSLARLQRATKNVSLFFAARGQFADSNLDSSQKIILGGPTGVRAYPVGEASGDEGHIFTMEKRLELPFMPKWMKTQLVSFVDAGCVKSHKDTWANSVTNISGRNHYWLSGAGAGLNFEKKGVYRLQCSYAHKIGKNIGRNTLDNDTDNRSDSGRFWIQATIWF